VIVHPLPFFDIRQGIPDFFAVFEYGGVRRNIHQGNFMGKLRIFQDFNGFSSMRADIAGSCFVEQNADIVPGMYNQQFLFHDATSS